MPSLTPRRKQFVRPRESRSACGRLSTRPFPGRYRQREPVRELTGSLRLAARGHSKAATSPPAAKAAVFRTNRRGNRVAASVESDKSDRMNYCDKPPIDSCASTSPPKSLIRSSVQPCAVNLRRD